MWSKLLWGLNGMGMKLLSSLVLGIFSGLNKYSFPICEWLSILFRRDSEGVVTLCSSAGGGVSMVLSVVLHRSPGPCPTPGPPLSLQLPHVQPFLLLSLVLPLKVNPFLYFLPSEILCFVSTSVNTANYDWAVFPSCDSDVGKMVHRVKSIYLLNGQTAGFESWH